jgi:hypothetical protein
MLHRSYSSAFHARPVATSLKYGSALFRGDLVPNANDSYTLSQLGASGSGKVVVDTGAIKYSVNGFGQGALGDGSTGPGIMFDVTGTSTYGVDDMFTPGTPWEGYAVLVNDSYYLGGSDTSNYPDGTQYFTQTTNIWNLSSGTTKHIVCLKGSAATGYLVIQHMSIAKETAVRIRLSYTNTTGSAVTVKGSREVDPDVEANSTSVYATNNYRGSSPLSADNFVYGQGQSTGKLLGIYCMPTTYTHTTSVNSTWPAYDFPLMLGGNNSGNGDYGIAAAWNAGTVAAGATVNFDCAYVCALNVAGAIKMIG